MEVRMLDGALEQFIENLEKATIAKVLRTIDLLEQFGNHLGMPHSRKVDRQLFELRIRGQQEVRILYAFRVSGAVLLHGFIKKSQHIPRGELLIARHRLRAIDSI